MPSSTQSWQTPCIAMADFTNARSLLLQKQVNRRLEKNFRAALWDREALWLLCYKWKRRQGGFPICQGNVQNLWGRTNLAVASWHCVGIVTLDLFLMKHRGRSPHFLSCNRALTTFSNIGIVRWVSWPNSNSLHCTFTSLLALTLFPFPACG